MKVMKKYRLVVEDRYSIGRFAALLGAIGFVTFAYLDFKDGGLLTYDISGKIITIFGYSLWVLFIVGGLYWHSRVKWPEVEEELYDDGWIRYRFYGYGRYEDKDIWIPGDLIVRIAKYKKKYSKRKRKWFVRLDIDMIYKGKAYTAVTYGWLKEPKSIEEFEEYVELIKKQIEKNTKGEEVKITFSMSGYSVIYWYKLGDGAKISEERNKQVERERSNGGAEHAAE